MKNDQDSAEINAPLLKRYEELVNDVIEEARKISGNKRLTKNKLFRSDRDSGHNIYRYLVSSDKVRAYLVSHNRSDYLADGGKNFSSKYLLNRLDSIKRRDNIRDNDFVDGIYEAFISKDGITKNVVYDGYYWSAQDHQLAANPFELSISIINSRIKTRLRYFLDHTPKSDRAYEGEGYFNEETNRVFLTLHSPSVDQPRETISLILSTPDSIHKIEHYDMLGSLLGLSSRQGRPILSAEVYLLRRESLKFIDQKYTLGLITKYLSLRRYSFKVRSMHNNVQSLSVHKGRYPVSEINNLEGTYYLIRASSYRKYKLSTLQINNELKGICYSESTEYGEKCKISLDMLSNTKFSIRINSFNSDNYITSDLQIRWSLDFETTLLNKKGYLTGFITLLRQKRLHQSPFIMYKVSSRVGEKDIKQRPLRKINTLENADELRREITSFWDEREAIRLIEYMRQKHPHLIY